MVRSDKAWSFQISTSSRKYIFAAFEQSSLHSWVAQLDKFIYGGILRQGWLHKKGEKNKGWRRRYFVLNAYGQIKYYQDATLMKFHGCIQLSSISAITNGKVYP